MWWLYLIVGIPIIAYLSAALNGTISDPFPFSPWYLVFPALAQGLFLLGTMEEFGWRGVAQPLLQRKLAPFWAGLVVGIIWATWHLPVFLFGEGFNMVPGPWFHSLVALSLSPSSSRLCSIAPRQPVDRLPVSLSDDESHLSRCSTLGQPPFCYRSSGHRYSQSAYDVQKRSRRHRGAHARAGG